MAQHGALQIVGGDTAIQVICCWPCAQVAIDFVCAESVKECLKLAEEMRDLCKQPGHAATPAPDRCVNVDTHNDVQDVPIFCS